MSRDMSSDMLAAIQASSLRVALFVTATFVTGPIYVWTGWGSITWGGHTWIGVGTLGGVSSIEESGAIQARGITLTLDVPDSTTLTNVLEEFQLKAPVTVYLGLFNSTPALITSPLALWAGEMGQPTIDVLGTTATISIQCEDRLVDMNTSVDRRYTSDDQQLIEPGDLGLSFVNGIQEAIVYWGTKPNNSVNV